MKEQRRGRRFGKDTKSAIETPPERALPEPDIPVLKEKEEEKKGAGAPWYAGSGSGAPGLVAGQGAGRVGASLAMRSGMLSRLAASVSGAFGGPTTFLGGLFAGALGKFLVGAGLAAWGALMLAAGARLMGGWGDAPTGAANPSMAGISGSGIVIDAPKDRSLGYLAGANKGEILWDQGKPVKADAPKEEPAPEAADAPAEQAKAPEAPKFEMPDVSQLMGGGLNREGFVKKMTGDVSQLSGGSGAPRLKDAGGFALKKSFAETKLPQAKTGKLGGMSKAKRALTSSRLSNMRGRSSRAVGQLKLAKNMSAAGADSMTASEARTFSADAFDQGKSIGGNLAGIDGDGIVVPPGSGVQDPGVPDMPPGTNVTPYQSDMDAAKGKGDQAAALKKLGMMMLAIGAALVAMGLALMGNHTTFPIGWALLGAGLALIAMGMMMLGMSANMANQAKNDGKKIADESGQKDQGEIVDECADQATNQGTKVDNCSAQKPDQVAHPDTSVHEAVEAESPDNKKNDPTFEPAK
ncbi:hypothetical protein EPO15_03100 [bacterium]|nr:MAG: hypothetical protein EPO15_03100 [bacterium]